MLCKRKRKKVKIQDFMYRDTTNVNVDYTNKIGATGIVTRSLRKNLEAVPGKHSTDSLQKTAILGTSHIIRKVLQKEKACDKRHPYRMILVVR